MNREFKSVKDRIVLSLEVPDLKQAENLVKQLKDYVGIFKIGVHLFIAEGPKIFEMIQNEGAKVYYDGKFNDIPNTVAKAGASLTRRGIRIFSLHISGGSKMLKACVEACHKESELLNIDPPTIVGITILTSIGQKTLATELGIPGITQDHCVRLTKIAQKSGLDGVVVGGCDLKFIRKNCGDDIIIVTTGIRPAWANINDQRRVLTPKEAIEAGADYLIVGRPVTQASEPLSAIKLIIDEIEEAIEGS